MLLRALSFAGINDTLNLKKELTKIINTDSEIAISKEAEYILDGIKNPSKRIKANEIALAESPYIFKSNVPHMSVIVLPKKGVDVNYLKTLLSDYHANDSPFKWNNFENCIKKSIKKQIFDTLEINSVCEIGCGTGGILNNLKNSNLFLNINNLEGWDGDTSAFEGCTSNLVKVLLESPVKERSDVA